MATLQRSVGAVAQLGERLNGIQEVVGSIPIGSTMLAGWLTRWCWPVTRAETVHAAVPAL